MNYQNYLMHFNPNHDPETGRFTDEHGRFVGVSERVQPSTSANHRLTKAEKDKLRKITIGARSNDRKHDCTSYRGPYKSCYRRCWRFGMNYPDYLMHFNPNHDPRNGQFAKGHGGNSITRAEVNAGRKILKAGKKVKQNITSDRGKKVLKAVAVAAACDIGMTFLMKRMGVQMRTAMKQGVFKFEKGSPVRELVKMAYRTPTDIKSVTMSAGKSAIKAGLATAGLMKIKDIIKARKEKSGENSK